MILVTDHGLPLVNVFCNFRAGPACDPPERAGLTSLTNRMLSRGTRKRARGDLEEAVEALGTELVTSTQRDALSVGGSVLGRNLEPFMDLLMEVLLQPAFDAEELEKVKREVVSELLADRDEDGTLAAIWFRRLLYAGHPFGHGGAGTLSGVQATTRADLLAHAERLYTRDNLLVGASGDVDATTLTSLLSPLNGLPGGALPWSFPTPAAAQGVRVALIDKPERSQTQILLGHTAFRANDPDHLAIELATTAFGGTFTARLMDEVRVKRGWSYGAHARLSSERAGGHFMVNAAPATQYAPETAALLLSEFAKFVDEGLRDDEIDFARAYLINAFPFRLETPGLRASQQVQARLLDRPDDAVATYTARLAALSCDAVRDAVRRRLTPRDVLLVMVCTADDVREKMQALPGLVDLQVIPFEAESVPGASP